MTVPRMTVSRVTVPVALPITPKSWVHFSVLPSARALAPGGIDGAGEMPRTVNEN
jgi:hypothetical protein